MTKIIILVQTIMIIFLSGWIYEEYLNNRYLREYLNVVIQTQGWAIAVVVVMVAVGSVTVPLFRRNRAVEKKVEPVFVEPKVAVPVTNVPGPVSRQPTEVNSKASTDLSPVVAALKAELAGRSAVVGTVPASSAGDVKLPPAISRDEQRTVTTNQPPILNPVAVPRAELAGAPVPGRAVPVARKDEATVPPGTQPPAHGPIIPRNVTTVITGFVPPQKKKEPETSADQKSSSQ